jgi:hypothetical protein
MRHGGSLNPREERSIGQNREGTISFSAVADQARHRFSEKQART